MLKSDNTKVIEGDWPVKPRAAAIKKEFENPGEQQVFHRKSERRRVARDIFLVFEEQPSYRRTRGSKRSRKSLQKPKFGHLKVEDPTKTKGLLRDIKNEPKCYLSTSCASKNRKLSNNKANESSTTATDDSPIARVNPIFLWVKQDDTRIVEVRCEDYDKRNRIRITKTTNGWRAIPRTDPSSSKIVKFLQTPLLKIKREVYETQLSGITKHDDVVKANQCLKQPQEAGENTSNYESSNTEVGDTVSTTFSNNKITKVQKDKRALKKSKIKNKKESKAIKSKEESCIMEVDESVASKMLDDSGIGETVIDSDSEHVLPITEIADLNCKLNLKDAEKEETYRINSPELHLCPKTGLFLPPTYIDGEQEKLDNFTLNSQASKTITDDFEHCEILDNKVKGNTEVEANFDADTKNLKDLLDDADLLQHCDDNINSDAELIDSLVKRSCENNLIQETELLKEAIVMATFPASGDDLSGENSVVDTLPRIIDTAAAEPPKCLSFNEAGEIEGLNGELFQSNNFIDSFEKDPVEEHQLSFKAVETTNVPLVQSPLIDPTNKLLHIKIVDEIPKDLSYKKREEVCPPPESRSQCAVTSSSDVVKSPERNEIPAIESTSKTIKNLILEQFIKFNELNTLPTQAGKQQTEPIDLGKHGDINATNDPSNYIPTTNFIETVIIDDNSDEEPVNKRLRNNVKSGSNEDKSSVIDKDPDPLTQLQLLIRNTQWKVPDPILVPKDRLSAVLASPAREIPLLITTRPELRLPEAFAYPDIIQNPNILVISMAQLEAILKNQVELEKEKSPPDGFISETSRKSNQQNDNEMHNEVTTVQPKETNEKCLNMESDLASDINAATLAVLNQMLWLPYFGQLSQEFLKSLKEPTNLQNKYPGLLPLYNHQIGLQHLDELYKNYIKQISVLKTLNTESSNHDVPNFSGSVGSCQNHLELAFFQKMFQSQINSYIKSNALHTDTPQRIVTGKNNTVQTKTNFSNANTLETKKARKTQADPAPISILTTFSIPDQNRTIELPQKCPSIKPHCDNALDDATEYKKFACVQKQLSESECKPRLTCKSLSNLLEPENVSAAVPLVNITSEIEKLSAHELGNIASENRNSEKKAICIQADSTLRSVRPSKSNDLNSTFDLPKQRKRSTNNYVENYVSEQTGREADTLNVDSNPALWHPLFGSNPKAGYSSPWQWTTVTATGE